MSIDVVIINTHASFSVLSDNKEWYLSMADIAKLDNKDVGVLILYGCDAGNLDYVGSNVASSFALKVNGAQVFASDGSVTAGRLNQAWIPAKYTWFLGPITYVSRGRGWVVYRANEGWGFQAYRTGKTAMSLKGLLDFRVPN